MTQAFSVLSADRGMVVDLYRRGDRVEAVMINFDPQPPPCSSPRRAAVYGPPGALTVLPVELTYAE